MGFKGGLVESIHHKEEVFNVTERFIGDVVLSSNTMTVGVGSDSWNNSKQSVDLLVSEADVFVDGFSSEGRIGIRFDCGESRDSGN